jgi:hypothetical protein
MPFPMHFFFPRRNCDEVMLHCVCGAQLEGLPACTAVDAAEAERKTGKSDGRQQTIILEFPPTL